MAYSQRSLARVIIEEPELPEEKLEAVLSRDDLLLAWKQQKAVCDLEELAECPKDAKLKPEGPCCPPPPLTEEERAQDLELRKALEQEIKAREEKEARRKRRRRRR
jgi:hypothetical protein